MSTANDPWGRVDADGTVYVRTAEGERVIGSWQAGSPEEALAFFRRKFEALNTEVTLLEQRVTTTDLSPSQARASIERLRVAVADAHAVGDLGQLQARLDALSGKVDHRQEEARAARDHARAEAKDIKERIVAEAEQLAAEATHWKISGERLRQLLEEWKAAPRADRAVEAARCLTSADSQRRYMLKSKNPAARAAVYDDAEVRKAFPMADLIRESIADAAPRPKTPYYTDVSTAVARTFHPPAAVNPRRTPAAADRLVTGVLHDRVLL